MKKALALLLVVMMSLSLVAMSIPAAAKEQDLNVKRGTPVIDGKLDEAYLDSFYDVVDENHKEFGFWGGGYLVKEDSPTGEFWALWDDNYLYVFAKVFDKNLCHSANPDGPAWCDDAIEFYIYQPDIDAGKAFCVEIDAWGENKYYNGGNKHYSLDGITYACTHEFVEDENWSGEDYNPGYYTIEVALPLENMTDGYSIGYCFQMDSIWTADTWDSDRYCSKTGSEKECFLTLISAEAYVAPEETEAPETEAPKQDDPKPIVNPGTADYALVASAVVVMAAAAAVVLKKRK